MTIISKNLDVSKFKEYLYSMVLTQEKEHKFIHTCAAYIYKLHSLRGKLNFNFNSNNLPWLPFSLESGEVLTTFLPRTNIFNLHANIIAHHSLILGRTRYNIYEKKYVVVSLKNSYLSLSIGR